MVETKMHARMQRESKPVHPAGYENRAGALPLSYTPLRA